MAEATLLYKLLSGPMISKPIKPTILMTIILQICTVSPSFRVYDPQFMFVNMGDFQKDINSINVVKSSMTVLKTNK